jgi:hypothetical protein
VTELAVVVPLAAMPVGATYPAGRIPLHVTVLSNVVLDGAPEVLVPALAAIAATTPVLASRAVTDELFGPNKDIAVTEIAVKPDLRRLRDRLFSAAAALGATPVVPAFHGDGYRAHATVTHSGERLAPGDTVVLGSLALLDCSSLVRRVICAAQCSGK